MKFLGFIMLTMIIGFPMLSCDEEGNPIIGGGGTVTISGTPSKGEKLIATSIGTFVGGFTWHYSDSEDGTFVPILTGATLSGTDDCEFTITDQIGSYYLFGSYIKASRGLTYSNALGPIVGTTQPPVNTYSVTITGQPKVGQTITASSTGNFSEGQDFIWQVSSNGTSGWSTASGAFGTNKKEFTITGGHVNYHLRAIRYRGVTSYESNAIGPITAN